MQIGVRELRQNASQYLGRVQQGEVIEVTSRGRVVARLVPVEGDQWEQLVAAGIVQPAKEDLLGISTVDVGLSASKRLMATREGER